MSTMNEALFIFSVCFDKGFNGPDSSFYATSRVQVTEWMLKQMRDNTKEGQNWREIFQCMALRQEHFKYNPEQTHEENESRRLVYILSRTAEELLVLIDDSYVDGDSHSQLSITEIKTRDIVDLTTQIQKEPQVEPKVLDKAVDVARAINCAFHDYCVSHLEWQGKSWYSHTVNSWREKRWVPIGEVGEHDPDHVCYGYWSHVWDANAEDKDGDPNDKEPFPYTPLKVAKVEDFRHVFVSEDRGCAFQLDEVVRLITPWYVSNDMGMNCDHRGSNHLGIYIEHLMEDAIEIPAGDYKFADLANLLWRLKGNKFDNQYEMVCTVDRENLDFQDGTLYVELPVDHGS
jgi:hypothetical protein